MTPRPLRRSLRIASVFVRYRLDELLEAAGLEPARLPLGLRLLWWLVPRRLLPRSQETTARRLRRALEELGPVFVKFGQILSTRRDLLPSDFADELAYLQDRVPPFDFHAARRIVEAELGVAIEARFSRFDHEALASASVAQVHAARLRPEFARPTPADSPGTSEADGMDVVVKIIRPGIDVLIRDDIALLRWIARTIEQVSRTGRRLHPVQIVDDYDRTIHDELDLRKEAANGQRLRANFAGSELLYVPLVYPELGSSRVLIEERIRGIPIADVERIRAAGTNMRRLAEVGVETFFTQCFEDNFFHADMHPGNVFVDARDPERPRYIALDFAIMGTLAPADQDYLARNIVAFFRQDYDEVARLHIHSGWIPPGTDLHEFSDVIRQVCEPIFAKPLKEISFGSFLIELFQTAQDFEIEIQPQLVLLQKTLLNIEGLGRQLYPDLDLWETAAPFMERWMAERIGPGAVLRHAGAVARRLPELVELAATLPDRLQAWEQQQQTQSRELALLRRELAASRRSTQAFQLGAAATVLLLMAFFLLR